MSQSKKNRSAMSGLLTDAKKDRERKRQKTSSADTDDKPNRDRFSVYADPRVFDRVRVWSTYLDVPQADIIERALAVYCDRLADDYNGGDDPQIPQHDKPTELP